MNVYAAYANGCCGGCYIIAANSIEEAKKLAKDKNTLIEWNGIYAVSEFELVPDLQTNRTQPGVICGDVFSL